MDAPVELVESKNRWRLPYRDMKVVQIQVSYRLTLVLDSGAQVDIETEALLSDGPPGAQDAPPARLAPERQDIAPALPLFGTKVASSVVFKSGSLHLVFGTGVQLTVQPNPQYEAWSARGPAGLLLVCQPGGGVALWS